MGTVCGRPRLETCLGLMLAFAGGMVLALACDFRLINSGKGLMCMNEVSLYLLPKALT